MKTNILITLCLILITSCQRQESIINEVFNQQEIEVIDKLIQYYDDFIQIQINNKDEGLSRSYLNFLQINTILAQQGRDMDVLRPSLKAQIDLFSNLKTEFLEEIFQIKEFDQNIGTNIEDKNPPLHINPNGKYVLFMQELAKVKPLFEPYAKELAEKGDIGEQCYETMMNLYPRIDFKNKDERFAFIVCILRRA